MRIVFVAWRDLAHPNAGGSEVVVDVLARSLSDRGHDVSLLCGGPVGERPYRVVANGGDYSQYLFAPFRYARHFHDVDLLVDVANGIPFFSPLWSRGPRLCFVHHVHAEQWSRYFPRPVAAACQVLEARGVPLVYRNTHFVAVSPSTGAGLEATGVPASHVHVVCNGVDIAEPPAPVPRSPEPLFVALGRMAANKRLDLLLDLWPAVHREVGGRLVIAGDGPDAGAIAARVAREPDLATVELAGRVDELRKSELLRQAWLLVHTAEREGWGLAILEAGLCRTPSLAYRVDGVRDAVIDGETGVLVDDDQAFVQEWIALARDRERRDRLGAAAAARATEFTWDRSVDGFMAAARVAIEDHRRAGKTARGEPLGSGVGS